MCVCADGHREADPGSVCQVHLQNWDLVFSHMLLTPTLITVCVCLFLENMCAIHASECYTLCVEHLQCVFVQWGCVCTLTLIPTFHFVSPPPFPHHHPSYKNEWTILRRLSLLSSVPIDRLNGGSVSAVVTLISIHRYASGYVSLSFPYDSTKSPPSVSTQVVFLLFEIIAANFAKSGYMQWCKYLNLSFNNHSCTFCLQIFMSGCTLDQLCESTWTYWEVFSSAFVRIQILSGGSWFCSHATTNSGGSSLVTVINRTQSCTVLQAGSLWRVTLTCLPVSCYSHKDVQHIRYTHFYNGTVFSKSLVSTLHRHSASKKLTTERRFLDPERTINWVAPCCKGTDGERECT